MRYDTLYPHSPLGLVTRLRNHVISHLFYIFVCECRSQVIYREKERERERERERALLGNNVHEGGVQGAVQKSRHHDANILLHETKKHEHGIMTQTFLHTCRALFGWPSESPLERSSFPLPLLHMCTLLPMCSSMCVCVCACVCACVRANTRIQNIHAYTDTHALTHS
jgi:hypothetical protein